MCAGRFDREHPAEHPLQDDSVWYLTPPEKSYVNITEAAKYSDVETLRRCLERGTQVDTRDRFYKTPLMIAASVGNVDTVRFLLESGWASVLPFLKATLVDLSCRRNAKLKRSRRLFHTNVKHQKGVFTQTSIENSI